MDPWLERLRTDVAALEDVAREEGRREGYAECQRDVVAWLRNMWRGDGIPNRLEAGEHVGAAKGGDRG